MSVSQPRAATPLDARLLASAAQDLRDLASQVADAQVRLRIDQASGLLEKVRSDLRADREREAALARHVTELSANGHPAELAAAVLELQSLRRGSGAGASAAGEVEPAPGDRLPSADEVTAYLRSRSAGAADVAHDVRAIVGGYSKRTLLVSATIDGTEQEIVLRQIPTGRRARSLGPEYEVVRAVHAAGLPAPKTLWYEPEDVLGGPFFVTRRVHGDTVGTVWGAEGISPELCLEVARVYARIHTMPTDGLVAPVSGRSTPTELTDMIAWQESTLVSRSLSGDPVLAALFDWLRVNLPPAPARPSLIHGDAAFSNLLISDGAVAAVLDWEASHLGDAAEELAYLRQSVESVVPWPVFLEHYVDAGGTAPSEHAMRFFEVWSYVWRHTGCLWLSQDYERSGRYASAVAAYVHGPRFLGKAVEAAFGGAGLPPVAPDL